MQLTQGALEYSLRDTSFHIYRDSSKRIYPFGSRFGGGSFGRISSSVAVPIVEGISGGIRLLICLIIRALSFRALFHRRKRKSPIKNPTTMNKAKRVCINGYLNVAVVHKATSEVNAIENRKIAKFRYNPAGEPCSKRSSSLSLIS